MNQLKRFFAYMGKKKYLYWTILIITLIAESTLDLLYSYTNKLVLNAIEYADLYIFKRAVIMCIAVVLIKCLFPYLRYWMIKLVRKMVFDLKLKLFEKLLRLDMSWYEKNHSAESLKTLNWDANSLKDAWFSHVYWVIGKLTLGVTAIVAMLVYSPLLAVISVIISVITAFVSIRINDEIKKAAKTVDNSTVNLHKSLSDILAGFQVIKMFEGASIITKQFLSDNKNVTDSEMKRVKKSAFLEMISFLLGIMGSFGTIIAGVYMVSAQMIDYGTVMAVVTLQISLSGAMQRLGGCYAILNNSLIRGARVFDFLELECEEELEEYDKDELTKLFGNNQPMSIQITDLGFSYDSKNVFNNWNIDIKPNEKVVLKGESGCGKSTLIKLLLRFYDYQKGSIKINDKDINNYPIKQIRDMITYIPQDCYLFEGSVYENIAYGNISGSYETVTMKEVEQAAKLAYADEFINELPQKYDTVISSGGTNLSGGQRQRIAIARAFLKNSPLLVMDEPSSALDYESEIMVHKALRELMKDKLVIMVSHRDSGEADFDRVVRM